MTEERYGKIWCLDHCLPLSKNNLSNENDVYKTTNWVNFRPMYVKDNIIKSDGKPPSRNFPTNKIVYNHIDEICSIDLADFLDY